MAEIEGAEDLMQAFERMKAINFQRIAYDSMRDIYNRGKAPGGTPVRTGELRASLNFLSQDTVGYRKEYSKPVEYGHHTPSGGYTPGQYYLKRNRDTQAPIFRDAILKAIQEAGEH